MPIMCAWTQLIMKLISLKQYHLYTPLAFVVSHIYNNKALVCKSRIKIAIVEQLQLEYTHTCTQSTLLYSLCGYTP